MSERGDDKALRARVKTAGRDVESLADHIGYLSTKITFLLDATLGMINNEQNTIIKIFSVLAVALMPPTLVGTIYGMNFKHIPELEWSYGYPLRWADGDLGACCPGSTSSARDGSVPAPRRRSHALPALRRTRRSLLGKSSMGRQASGGTIAAGDDAAAKGPRPGHPCRCLIPAARHGHVDHRTNA